MRRLLVVLTALLMLAGLAAPAAAKPGNSDKPGPALTFSVEPWAEYLADSSLCVADVSVGVVHAGKGSLVVFEASRTDAEPGQVLQHTEEMLRGRLGGLDELLFSYEFPCDSAIKLDVTHVATMYDRKGTVLVSVTETRLMAFLTCRPEGDTTVCVFEG